MKFRKKDFPRQSLKCWIFGSKFFKLCLGKSFFLNFREAINFFKSKLKSRSSTGRNFKKFENYYFYFFTQACVRKVIFSFKKLTRTGTVFEKSSVFWLKLDSFGKCETWSTRLNQKSRDRPSFWFFKSHSTSAYINHFKYLTKTENPVIIDGLKN